MLHRQTEGHSILNKLDIIGREKRFIFYIVFQLAYLPSMLQIANTNGSWTNNIFPSFNILHCGSSEIEPLIASLKRDVTT